MQKQAVIIYGPPGSGKGTQAELLARKYNFIHFDTGRYGESILYAPGALKDPILRRERKNFDTGVLFTPSWTLRMVSDATRRIAAAGWNIVYSGSPRTAFEAFGDKKQKGLTALLSKLYGKRNVKIIFLQIRGGTTLKRNGARFVCSVCGLPKLARSKESRCAFCSGLLRERSLDDPKVISVRLKEYENRTFPIISKMKKRGFKVVRVNGEPLPYKVFESVKKTLKLK
ncbi:MAG: nucleoside monophosphate kinase [Minisyncoccia bacterium]